MQRSLITAIRKGTPHTAFHITKSTSSISSFSSKSSTFGVVFDVDGVLLRGKKAITGAKEVLQDLQRHNIPYAIMTNGGGYLESKKAKQIADIIGVNIPSSLLCMSHTPMKTLVKKHGDELVLAVGKDCHDLHAVMTSYGFKNVVTVGQLHNHFPTMYPDIKMKGLAHHGRFEKEAFGAVFVLIDPIYWGRELQIVMDVLCAQDGRLGKMADKQHVSHKILDLMTLSLTHYITMRRCPCIRRALISNT